MSRGQTPELEAAYARCRAIAKAEAKNFFYGFLLLPAPKRDAMCAVYAFMRRADDISDDESFTVEDRRLQMATWLLSWRSNLAVGASDELVFLAVRDVQRRYAISNDLLEQLVQGTTMDLDATPPDGVQRQTVAGRTVDVYTDMAALERYCYLVASVVGLVTIRIFGFTDARADAYAEQLGLAFQLTNILRDVREDAERGRIYLPADLLAVNGLTPVDVLTAADTGSTAAPFAHTLRALGDRASELYGAKESLIPLLAPDSRAAMRVLIRIYQLLLTRIVRMNYRVMEQRASVPTARKLLVLSVGFLQKALGR